MAWFPRCIDAPAGQLRVGFVVAFIAGACAGDSGSDDADNNEDEACPVGSEGCACTGGGTCDPGFACLSGICVDPGSADEADGSEATSGTPSDGSVDDNGDDSTDGDATESTTGDGDGDGDGDSDSGGDGDGDGDGSGECTEWTHQLGTIWDEAGQGVAVDSEGAVFVTGRTAFGIDGQPSAGNEDIFLTKYLGDGTKQWTSQVGTSGYEGPWGAGVDSQNAIYVVVDTEGFLDGQPGLGERDIGLIKFDTQGNEVWTRVLGSPTDEWPYGIVVDDFDHIYIAGVARGPLDGQMSAGQHDVVVSRYDTNGTRLWTRQFGTAGLDYAQGIAADAEGNVIAVGNSSADFAGTSAGAEDLIAIKLDPDGNELWRRQLGTAEVDAALAATTDSELAVYVAGYTWGGLDGQSWNGNVDFFVTKYDAAGSKQWTRQLGTELGDYLYGAATTADDGIVLTGLTTGSLEGQPHAGGYDVFVAQFDTAGTLEWVRQFGTEGQDLARDIAVDPTGGIVVCGDTSADFAAPNLGADDMIVARICP